MNLAVKLALKNLLGAGMRTWLNVTVLSMTFVTIIAMQGLYQGMNDQITHTLIEMELAGGQIWHHGYDPFDPFTLDDAWARIPSGFGTPLQNGDMIPLLFRSATLFPSGRAVPVVMKGIPQNQKILGIPTEALQSGRSNFIPALIGSRMAAGNGLEKGDTVTLRWRDVHGTFDAAEIEIVHIMHTDAESVDAGQIWLSLPRLQAMLRAPDAATIFVLAPDTTPPESPDGWTYHNLSFLLRDITEMIRQKSTGASIMYSLLMFMAMLAIFDTQVLAVFRRRKEMGTLISLGMTRSDLVGTFTLEGTLHGLLALLLSACWGWPLLSWFEKTGWTMPEYFGDVGLSLGKTLFPKYGISLVVLTSLLVMTTVIIVSWFPVRKISRLNPTEALKGKLT